MENETEVIEEVSEVVEIETVSKVDFDALQVELDEVKAKLPVDETDAEKALKQRERELFDKEVALTLKEHGVSEFESILYLENAEELKEVIPTLKQIVNDLKIAQGFIPVENTTQSAYDSAKQTGDTKGMIKSIFGLK